jgi:predicted nuclease of predicted toxin-antitoxin system
VRRVLLDEQIPRLLRRALPGFHVSTVDEAGFKGKKNGELLRLASERFECFLTADRGLVFQQNLASVRIGVVLLRLGSTKLPDITEYAHEISTALGEVKPGELLVVERR